MRGLIFDCDGTLIDSEGAHFEAWDKALQMRGARISPEDYVALAGHPIQKIAEKLHQRIQIDSPDALLKDKCRFYSALQKKGLPPLLRTLSFLQQLLTKKKELQLSFGLASAAPHDEITTNLQLLNLNKAFDAIVSGSDDLPAGCNKPHPHIYLKAASLLKLDPKQCVAFEDTSTGVLAAKRAGMKVIALPNAYTLHQDFSQASHVMPPDFQFNINTFFELFI